MRSWSASLWFAILLDAPRYLFALLVLFFVPIGKPATPPLRRITGIVSCHNEERTHCRLCGIDARQRCSSHRGGQRRLDRPHPRGGGRAWGYCGRCAATYWQAQCAQPRFAVGATASWSSSPMPIPCSPPVAWLQLQHICGPVSAA